MRSFNFGIHLFGLCRFPLWLQQGRMGQTVGSATTDGKKEYEAIEKEKRFRT